MKENWKQIWQLTLVLLAAAAFGVADTTNMPPPGTLNYTGGPSGEERFGGFHDGFGGFHGGFGGRR